MTINNGVINSLGKELFYKLIDDFIFYYYYSGTIWLLFIKFNCIRVVHYYLQTQITN